MRFNSLLSVFPSFLLFFSLPPSLSLSSLESARTLLSRGWCPPPLPRDRESRCNDAISFEHAGCETAGWRDLHPNSLHAAVTTFQRSLSVRLCERPCVSSRPTCIARHNFTDRARCRRENAQPVVPLVLSSLPSRVESPLFFLAGRSFIEEISPDVDLGLRPRSNSFRTNVCSKRGFFPQFNPLHFSRVLINARLTHRIPSNHGFKIVGPQIFIPHIPVPLNPGRLFTAPVVHRTTHALFAHRPLRVLFLFQRLSL